MQYNAVVALSGGAEAASRVLDHWTLALAKGMQPGDCAGPVCKSNRMDLCPAEGLACVRAVQQILHQQVQLQTSSMVPAHGTAWF